MPESQSRARRGIWPRTWRGRAGAVLGGLFVLAIILWLMARGTPGWYQPLDPTVNSVLDNADIAQRKLAFELHNTMQRVPLGEQTWSITQDQVNSLLAVRFSSAGGDAATGDAGDVVKAREALPLSGPFVLFSEGKVTIAVRSTKLPGGDAKGGVGSAAFDVETVLGKDGNPKGVIRVVGAHVGRLPVPKWIVEEQIRRMAPTLGALVKQELTYQFGVKDSNSVMPEVEGAIRAISAGEPFPMSFWYDHRPVVVKEIRVEEGVLTVVFAPPVGGSVPLPLK